MRVRAKNLGDKEIAAIVGVLDGWSGKLSWELLIEAIAARGLGCYTRQALHRHVRIHHAFNVRKESLAKAPAAESQANKDVAPELQAAQQRIERLEAENARLAAENHRLLEQFVCWAYNAHTRGLDKDFLSRPLPRVDRELSVTNVPKPARKPSGQRGRRKGGAAGE